MLEDLQALWKQARPEAGVCRGVRSGTHAGQRGGQDPALYQNHLETSAFSLAGVFPLTAEADLRQAQQDADPTVTSDPFSLSPFCLSLILFAAVHPQTEDLSIYFFLLKLRTN